MLAGYRHPENLILRHGLLSMPSLFFIFVNNEVLNDKPVSDYEDI